MNEKELLRLADELTIDLDRLQQVKTFIAEIHTRYNSRKPDELELYIPGGVLHDLYNGIEAIFSRIARHLDNNIPGGANSHRELLDQMKRPFPHYRYHSVIHPNTALSLEEYRRFRHVVRVNYGFSLNWERMKPLIDNAIPILETFINDIEQFITSLRMKASDS